MPNHAAKGCRVLFEAKHKSLAGFFKVEYSRDEPLRLRYDMAKQFDMNKAGNIVYNLDGKNVSIYMGLGIEKETCRDSLDT